jgi:orotate phosphoribosyltransferase-like protein
MFQKVFAALKNEGLSRSDVADELHVRSEDLDALLFGLILTGVGGKKDEAQTSGGRKHLRIVDRK